MSKRTASELLISPAAETVISKRMDIKDSPIKELTEAEAMSEFEKSESILKIQETAPSWFMEAFSFIIK